MANEYIERQPFVEFFMTLYFGTRDEKLKLIFNM
jgi:hypothetical protein